MISALILVSIIIFICVILNNATNRLGMPVLLAFILLGMLFGGLQVFDIGGDDSYKVVERVSTVALIFIMFYGGYGTRWSAAKPVAVESGLLATVGVVLTAGITGACCHFLLGWNWIESLLMGSVVSSTDAASVFSILRSRKLGLKNGSASLLELESGSNDPCSYMMTVIMLSLIEGGVSAGNIALTLLSQLGFGAIFGVGIALAATWFIKHVQFRSSGYDSLFVLAVAIISYALPSAVNGNGYLSAYIVGIILGNQTIGNKKELVHFFDGVTSLMQVIIFFMLGLLAKPANLQNNVTDAVVIFLILLLVSRPLTVFMCLTPFKKYSFKQQILVSFAGLRGAASIVFAIMAMSAATFMGKDIFNVVFCIVLVSISLQGTLLPFVAKKLGQIDEKADVMKTFTDFSEETDLQFTEIKITKENSWCNKLVKDLGLPRAMLLCQVVKMDGKLVLPNGNTLLEQGDKVIICTQAYNNSDGTLMIVKHEIPENSRWVGLPLKDYSSTQQYQIILIERGRKRIIPNGNTILKAGDLLYINQV
jgi:cell volume regulation protein A